MKYRLIIAGVLLIMTAVGAFAQKAIPGDAPFKEDFRSPFRYIVVSDVTELQKGVNEAPYYWTLEVLMEDKAFNEKNLIELFTILSKRYADRPGLFVYVFTSLEPLRTPEEHDHAVYWGHKENYRRDHKYAYFSRNGYGERFEYGIPAIMENKEIIIKPPPSVGPPK